VADSATSFVLWPRSLSKEESQPGWVREYLRRSVDR
jgi:hypothetical protein